MHLWVACRKVACALHASGDASISCVLRLGASCNSMQARPAQLMRRQDCIFVKLGSSLGCWWGSRYNLVATSAAGGVVFFSKQRSLAVGSYRGRQCHSCCEQTCLHATIPPSPQDLSLCPHGGLRTCVALQAQQDACNCLCSSLHLSRLLLLSTRDTIALCDALCACCLLCCFSLSSLGPDRQLQNPNEGRRQGFKCSQQRWQASGCCAAAS
jgi:hypothetical protein